MRTDWGGTGPGDPLVSARGPTGGDEGLTALHPFGRSTRVHHSVRSVRETSELYACGTRFNIASAGVHPGESGELLDLVEANMSQFSDWDAAERK